MQNKKKKWKCFHFVAKLRELGYLVYVIDKQRISNDGWNQDKRDGHPLYTGLWRFDFSKTLFKNWLKEGADIKQYQILSFWRLFNEYYIETIVHNCDKKSVFKKNIHIMIGKKNQYVTKYQKLNFKLGYVLLIEFLFSQSWG